MVVAEDFTSWQSATVRQKGEDFQWINSYAIFERIESVHLAILLYVRSCHDLPSNKLGWQLCAG